MPREITLDMEQGAPYDSEWGGEGSGPHHCLELHVLDRLKKSFMGRGMENSSPPRVLELPGIEMNASSDGRDTGLK